MSQKVRGYFLETSDYSKCRGDLLLEEMGSDRIYLYLEKRMMLIESYVYDNPDRLINYEIKGTIYEATVDAKTMMDSDQSSNHDIKGRIYEASMYANIIIGEMDGRILDHDRWIDVLEAMLDIKKVRDRILGGDSISS